MAREDYEDQDYEDKEQLSLSLSGETSHTSESVSDVPHNGVDPRNILNDLTNKDWMISTKSIWRSEAAFEQLEGVLSSENLDLFHKWLTEHFSEEKVASVLEQVLPSVLESRPAARDSLKSRHPATFAESDIEKLILYFTKEGETVLDPFVGSGSTLVACKAVRRQGIGIELVSQWAEIARRRLGVDKLPLFELAGIEEDSGQRIIEGDARRELQTIEGEAIDFIVTSPPYWSILHKDTDHKVRRERKTKGLETRYSESDDDLGNIGSYREFLGELQKVFIECNRVLRNKKYMCVVVSDFRDRGKFIPYHADLSDVIEQCGFALQGITILVQDSKNLYPYGIPYAFVSNIHHQYILVFRKIDETDKEEK